jgi:hypothetical protein
VVGETWSLDSSGFDDLSISRDLGGDEGIHGTLPRNLVDRLQPGGGEVTSLGRRPGLLRFVDGNSVNDQAPCVLPKAERRFFGINVDQRPPCFLIHLAVQLAVVNAAKWDRELVADFAAKGPRLHKPKVVGIAGLPTTHQTRQGGDKIEVLLVDPPRSLWHRAPGTSIRARIRCEARAVSEPVRSPGSGGSQICFMLLLGQSAIPLMADAGGAPRCAWFGLCVRYRIATQLCTRYSWQGLWRICVIEGLDLLFEGLLNQSGIWCGEVFLSPMLR